MVATPVLALLTDVQSAILLTLAPTLAVNLWSMLHGGNLWTNVSRFWPIAIWMLVGSALGTVLLVYSDPNPFRLLLAAVIVLYLLSDVLKQIPWGWIRVYPRASGSAAGFMGGMLAGTVNVGGPTLMIYFLEMRVAPLVFIQSINFSFFLSKSTQTATFAVLGQLSIALLLFSIPLGIMALAGLRAGMWIRDRYSADAYRSWLRALLWVLVVLLVVQFFRQLG